MQPRRIKPNLLQLVLGPALVATVGIILSVATTSQARADYPPLLVLADDEDPTTVARKSTLFKDLVSLLAADLQRHGIPVIDEDTLLADLGREIPNRRTREEQVSMVRDTAEHGMKKGIREFVQLRLSVSVRQTTGYGAIRIDVYGEIFSYPGIQVIDAIQFPPHKARIPSDCNRDCIIAHAKKSYGMVAMSLGAEIARTSSALLVAEVPNRPDEQSDADMMYTGTPFTVTLRHFKRSEALTIIGVMADEFPGYQDHDLIALDTAEARYLYVTSATRAKLLEWLNILLGDIGFEADAIAMTFSEDDITIENIAVATPGSEAE